MGRPTISAGAPSPAPPASPHPQSPPVPPKTGSASQDGSERARSSRFTEAFRPVSKGRSGASEGSSADRTKALETIRYQLDPGFWGVYESEVETAVDTLAALSSEDAAAVIETLDEEGLLHQLGAKLERYGRGRSGAQLRARFVRAMAEKLNGSSLVRVEEAMRGAGESSRVAFMEGFSRSASPDRKLAFVVAAAAKTTDDTPTREEYRIGFGTRHRTTFEADGEAASVAGVVASLEGEQVARALGALTPTQRAAVFEGGLNVRDLEMSEMAHPGEPVTTDVTEADMARFGALMGAVGSIPEAEARGSYLDAGLRALGSARGVSPSERSKVAEAALARLDDEALLHLSPDGMAALAQGLAESKSGPLSALRVLSRRAASPNRDALVRTLFLKTPGGALPAPEVARAFARGLAGEGRGADARAAALERALQSEGGRALLADDRVSGPARLWAARELVNGRPEVKAALRKGRPWESHALLESYGRAGVEQLAARPQRAVSVDPKNLENLIGAALGAPVRADFPKDEAGLAAIQGQMVNGGYNAYRGIEAVEKVAAGIREARAQMGQSDIAVAPIPVQFSSQATGPVDLKLYRVEGKNGEQRFVDNTGRVYGSFDLWKKNNQLPPGKMTFPADGRVGAPGETELKTENTPQTIDSNWERAGYVLDMAALTGGVIASGVLLVGSGGTATPVVAGAWAVALGSAGYMGAKAGYELYDRHAHGQTLAMTDPDARAAWLSLAGSGLTLAGAGAMGRAAAMAQSGSKFAPAAARAAGILNTSANFADAAGTVDQAQALVASWDQLTPAQRAQMGLSIAFWAGMTGVSSKASGGKVTDAFSFRAQMNSALIETGAAVRANPRMSPGHARVHTGYAKDGSLNLSVEYGPGTSKAAVRIHQDVARALIDNSGAQGLIRRTLGDGTRFPPGSRGEEVALEVVKHRALVKAFDEQAPNAPERTYYAAELKRHEAELARLRKQPAEARGPGRGHVDALSAEQFGRAVAALEGTEAAGVVRSLRGEQQTLVSEAMDQKLRGGSGDAPLRELKRQLPADAFAKLEAGLTDFAGRFRRASAIADFDARVASLDAEGQSKYAKKLAAHAQRVKDGKPSQAPTQPSELGDLFTRNPGVRRALEDVLALAPHEPKTHEYVAHFLRRVADGRVAPAQAEGTLRAYEADLLRFGGRMGGDLIQRYADAELGHASAASELTWVRQVLEGSSPLGPVDHIEAIPESKVNGVKTPDFRIQKGDQTHLVENKRPNPDTSGTSGSEHPILKPTRRNIKEALEQVVAQRGRSGESSNRVRVDLSHIDPLPSNDRLRAQVERVLGEGPKMGDVTQILIWTGQDNLVFDIDPNLVKVVNWNGE